MPSSGSSFNNFITRATAAHRLLPRLASFFAAGLFALILCAPSYAQTRRPINLDDLARMRDVRDPQCSPDGQWVAYTVSTTDAKTDKHCSDVWMVSIDGSRDMQVTASQESEGGPRVVLPTENISRSLPRVPARPKAIRSGSWIAQGGEAMQFTDVKGHLQSYEWSPDSKRLALVVVRSRPRSGSGRRRRKTGCATAHPKPVVIDRYHFRQDGVGYLLSRSSQPHLPVRYRHEKNRTASPTANVRRIGAPCGRPTARTSRFVSNHAIRSGSRSRTAGFCRRCAAGRREKEPVSNFGTRGTRGRLAWSPDGKSIAFLVGDEKKLDAYGMSHLASFPLTAQLLQRIL